MPVRTRKYIKTILIILGLSIMVMALKDIFPLLKAVVTSSMSEQSMVSYISEYGYQGIFLLFTLNVIPQLLVFIPQIPVTILTGLCYGAFWGSLISLAGQGFGIGLLYIFLRKLRKPITSFIYKHIQPDKVEKARSLFQRIKLMPVRAGYLIIICFYLIPGLPSTLTPFLFAWTNCSLLAFLVCMMIGSTPATLIYCYSGELVQVRNWKLLLLVVVIVVIIALVLYRFKEAIIKFLLAESKNK